MIYMLRLKKEHHWGDSAGCSCHLSEVSETEREVIYTPHKTRVLESGAEHLQIQLK